MAVRVIDSAGRRSGLPGKKTQLYTVNSYGGSRLTSNPLGITVYSTVDQTIYAGGWNAVLFNTAQVAPISYGLPAMWTSGYTVSILDSGWYWMSASVQLYPVETYNTYQWFRFATISGVSLPGGSTYVEQHYSFPISGDVPYYLNAGDGVQLHMAHNHGSAITMFAGVMCSGLTIERFSS